MAEDRFTVCPKGGTHEWRYSNRRGSDGVPRGRTCEKCRTPQYCEAGFLMGEPLSSNVSTGPFRYA